MNKIQQELMDRLTNAEKEQKEFLASLEKTALYQNYLKISEEVRELKEIANKLKPPPAYDNSDLNRFATYGGGIYNNSLQQQAFNQAQLNKK